MSALPKKSQRMVARCRVAKACSLLCEFEEPEPCHPEAKPTALSRGQVQSHEIFDAAGQWPFPPFYNPLEHPACKQICRAVAAAVAVAAVVVMMAVVVVVAAVA